MKQLMCMRHYQIGNVRYECELKDCPLTSRNFKKLKEEPCCLAIFVPAAFLTEAKGNRAQAARKYVDEWLLSE